MSKHTPGPWEVVADERYDSSSCLDKIVVYDIKAIDREIVGSEGISGESNTNLANATLIAAAPDLLAALEDIYAITEREKTNLPLCFAYSHGKAANAIARAKGESA
jgi:hypothetical protein